jgi:hypothetical protein
MEPLTFKEPILAYGISQGKAILIGKLLTRLVTCLGFQINTKIQGLVDRE